MNKNEEALKSFNLILALAAKSTNDHRTLAKHTMIVLEELNNGIVKCRCCSTEIEFCSEKCADKYVSGN